MTRHYDGEGYSHSGPKKTCEQCDPEDRITALQAAVARYHYVAEDLVRERDAAIAERDALKAECASISAEFDLPPGIRPAEGEIRRMRDGWNAAVARAERAEAERDELEEECERKVSSEWAIAIQAQRGVALARAEKAEAELVKYREAVADQLQYDMKSALTGTPERRIAVERDALRAQVQQLTDALHAVTLDLNVTEPTRVIVWAALDHAAKEQG